MQNGNPYDLALKSCIVDLGVYAYNLNKQMLLVSSKLFRLFGPW